MCRDFLKFLALPSSIVQKLPKKKSGSETLTPTVKPIELMKYLCRLITPPDGIILDPFAGSGTTGIAALKVGSRFIGVEKDESYFSIAKTRLEQVRQDVIFQEVKSE
jgi:site-specific DNA-methyltransferase (adenine-specific)